MSGYLIRYKKLKSRTYQILEKAEKGDKTSLIFDIFILTLIILNVISVPLETVKGLYNQYSSIFWYFEIISVIIFTIEYILRLWSCTSSIKYKRRIIGRIKFLSTMPLLIDLFAILPFYIPMIIPVDLRFIRILRLFRMFRIFKMGRYSNSLVIIVTVLKRKKEELVMTLVFTILLIFIASTLMYYAESSTQPDKFTSIPATFWWGICTLTTVGYGDVFPVTPLGKIFSGVISLLGIGIVALPSGILASGFTEIIQEKKEKNNG